LIVLMAMLKSYGYHFDPFEKFKFAIGRRFGKAG